MTDPPAAPMEASSAPNGDGLPDLLARAARGDDDAWRGLIALYGRRIFAMARSRCGREDVAEEITQSVLVTVASKLGSEGTGGYTEQGRFESWLFRVTMNRVRDELRRRARHAEPTDPHQLADVREDRGPAPGGAENEQEVSQLREAMTELGDSDRQVVELRHHAGLSFRQIADVLEEPLGTVLARHHRALRKLRDLMEGIAAKINPGRARRSGL